MADEEEGQLLPGVWSPSLTQKPPSITPASLSLERRKYLYEKLREYCREDVKDHMCPNPHSPLHEPPPEMIISNTQKDLTIHETDECKEITMHNYR